MNDDAVAPVGQVVRSAVDIASVSVVIATIMQWLPSIAAFLTIVWTALRIYEMDTVQKLIAALRVKS